MNEVRLTPAVAVAARGNTSSAGAGDRPKLVDGAGQSQSAGNSIDEVSRGQAEQAAADEAVNQAVADLNKYMQHEQRDLRFSIDDGTGEVVVRVVDRTSGELIRQIPNDVTLDLAARARQNEPLQLVNLQG